MIWPRPACAPKTDSSLTLHVDSSNVAQRSAGFIHICRMTIVTTYRHRPKRPAKPAQIKVPRIVQHTPRGRAWKLPVPDDPEAKDIHDEKTRHCQCLRNHPSGRHSRFGKRKRRRIGRRRSRQSRRPCRIIRRPPRGHNRPRAPGRFCLRPHRAARHSLPAGSLFQPIGRVNADLPHPVMPAVRL
jgi:hypothetical protein